MKNSGIEWIGNIPDNWKVKRVKNCFYLSKEKAHLKDPVVLRLARSGVHVKDVTTNEGQMAESYEDYNPVCVGDLLLNPMDLYSGANCNVSEVEGVISPAYQNLRKKIELNPKYFDYYFKTQYWTMAMFAHGKGISFDNRWTINSETILNYYLPFPSLDEQNKIVLALNNKLSQVDDLIANQQAQIEKLKEYKQSVITEAVTKGLDKSAPLKDSGILHIGQIPLHWRVKKHKYVFKKEKILCEKYAGEDILSLTMNGVIVRDLDNPMGKMPTTFDGYQYVKEGNLLLCLFDIDVTPRCVGVIKNNGLTSPAYSQYRIISGDNVNYFYYLLLALDFKKDLLYLSKNLRSTLSDENFGLIETIIPPSQEQQQIVDYLDEKCGKIDRLIAIKQEKIEKLQEYKKSLIYEYVTGKKEVV